MAPGAIMRSSVLLIVVLISSVQGKLTYTEGDHTASMPGCSNRLFRGQRLPRDQQLCSQNLRFRLRFEQDGRTLIRDVRSNTTYEVVSLPGVGVIPSYLTLSGDGVLKAVAKDATNYWTSSFGGAMFMELQNNGAFAAFHQPNGSAITPLWNTPIEYAVRLEGGGRLDGRLEIFFNMQWNGVCVGGFNDSQAAVACRSIGLSGGSATAIPVGSTPSHIQSVPCTGSEKAMQYCNVGGWLASTNSCAEARVVCTNATTRLADETQPGSGRLLVNRNGTWGAVCGHSFTPQNAIVACRTMGFTAAISSAILSTPVEPILMRNLRCTGSETSIYDCAFDDGDHCDNTTTTGMPCNSGTTVGPSHHDTTTNGQQYNQTTSAGPSGNQTATTGQPGNQNATTAPSSNQTATTGQSSNLTATTAPSSNQTATTASSWNQTATSGPSIGQTSPTGLLDNQTTTDGPCKDACGPPCDNTTVALNCQPPIYDPQSLSPPQLYVCSNRLLVKYPIGKDKLLCAGTDNEYTLQLTDDSRLTLMRDSQVLWTLGNVTQGNVADTWQLNAFGQLEILDNSGGLHWSNDVPLFDTNRDGEAYYVELQTDGSLNVFSTKGVSGWSKPSASEALSFSWVGCFQDFNESSNGSRYVTPQSTVSPQQCLTVLMAAYRSPFVGVLEGRTCRSFVSLNSSSLRRSAECNVTCSGDSASTCGGAMRVSVYRVRKASNNRPLSAEQSCRTSLMVGDTLLPGEDLCSPSGNQVLHITPKGTILGNSDLEISSLPNTFVLIDETMLIISDTDGNPTQMAVPSQSQISFFEFSNDGYLRMYETSGKQFWRTNFHDDDKDEDRLLLGMINLDGSDLGEAATVIDRDDTTCTTNLPMTMDFRTPWFVFNATLQVTVTGGDMRCDPSKYSATDIVSLYVPTECYSDPALPCATYRHCSFTSGEGTMCSFDCSCGANRCHTIRLKMPGCAAWKKATICDVRI